jgi:cbb3-type cytochrome oxidase maturation protein
MSAIFIMIGASLLLAIGFLIAFIWSVRSNQYEDDYTPSVRMLFDNTTIQETKQETNNKTKKKQIIWNFKNFSTTTKQ